MGADHKAQIDAYNVAVLLVRRQVISQIILPTGSPKKKKKKKTASWATERRVEDLKSKELLSLVLTTAALLILEGVIKYKVYGGGMTHA